MREITTDTAAKPQSCGLATWSLVLGITGLVLCVLIIPSILAVIFGIVALVKIGNSKGLLVGKGKAIAGIILGGLWVVMIPFIAIVAAIAIPNLLSGRISANEASAAASLKLMTSAEALWRQQDADGNGAMDYWTYDVSCFYRALRPDNATEVAFIPIDLARADINPARSDVFGNTYFRITDLPELSSMPKNGYLFRAMELESNGQPYGQEMVDGIPAANQTKFAFVAYPATYGTTGVNTYIVNQEGTIYCTDCGSDSQKTVLQWPGINPCEEYGPGGRQWRVRESY
ncbi:MAG: DUF2950 family protein [Planctomycetes bacterium]|nr:DUF2950 family protein [Planctomycetota bacterium]